MGIFMEKVLKTHYHRGADSNFFLSSEYQGGLRQHTHERFGWADDDVVPWINTAFDLTGETLVEVGCGTGSA